MICLLSKRLYLMTKTPYFMISAIFFSVTILLNRNHKKYFNCPSTAHINVMNDEISLKH